MATGTWTDACDTVLNTNMAGTYVISNTVDMTDVIAGTSVTGAAGDIVECLSIPADTWVQAVIVETTTATGVSSSTIDVGDGDDADGWLDGVDSNATAVYNSKTLTLGEATPNTMSPAFGVPGKVYTATDTIDVLIKVSSAVSDDLEFKIWAICTPLN